MLQESLGGNAKTTLVVAVADAQEHAEETFNSLQFGSRAMCVQTQVRLHTVARHLTACRLQPLLWPGTRATLRMQHSKRLEATAQDAS